MAAGQVYCTSWVCDFVTDYRSIDVSIYRFWKKMSNIVVLHIILDQFLGPKNESGVRFSIRPNPGSYNSENTRIWSKFENVGVCAWLVSLASSTG